MEKRFGTLVNNVVPYLSHLMTLEMGPFASHHRVCPIINVFISSTKPVFFLKEHLQLCSYATVITASLLLNLFQHECSRAIVNGRLTADFVLRISRNKNCTYKEKLGYASNPKFWWAHHWTISKWHRHENVNSLLKEDGEFDINSFQTLVLSSRASLTVIFTFSWGTN